MPTHYLYKRIEALLDTPAHYVRDGWKHYPCPVCGTGKHPWPPLGIHEATGKVKCLRCGLSMSIGGGSTFIRGKERHSVADSFSWKKTTRGDGMVDMYMESRGIRKKYYAYGRGKYKGMAAFPSLDLNGTYSYAQFRGRRKKTSTTTEPRIDTKYIFGNQQLVVVEGNIDKLALAQLGISTTAVFGTNPARSVISDLKKIQTPIAVLFDAEPHANNCAHKLVMELYGYVEVSMIRWPELDGSDPAELAAKDKNKLLEIVYRGPRYYP